ncbi:MAG: PD-(D/E)XK nuclease family protein [Saprospiraceae bacterium]
MEFLLEKIGIINMKYEKLEENDQFNIFPILRKLHDEVHLHSQFIFELLNPNGSHNKGTIFLESFLEEIKIDSFELEEIEVEKELYNIDILINNKHQAIIVENKIRAKDQDKQIERYYNLIKEQGFREIKIVYLKPFEENPSKESLGDLPSEVIEKELIVISYHKEILNWIEKCISISTRHPALRETLIQYSNVVKEITNQGMSEDKEKEVIELLSKNNENIM